MRRLRSVLAASFAFLLVAGDDPLRAGAQELPGSEPPPVSELEDEPGPSDRTPPRLSHIDGAASFWRDGAEAWSEARVNTPLAAGDQLFVDNGANLELQIGPRDFLRVASNSQLALDSDESDYQQYRLTNGRAALDLRGLQPGQSVEIDTPHGAFTIDHNGYYRTEVGADATTFVARRGGRATVTPAGGELTAITSNQQVVVRRDDVESFAATEMDAWDRWNDERSDGLVQAASYRHVPEAVYGVDDLDHNGRWRVVPDYGSVWFPTRVASNWAPYTTGRWMRDPYYGWSWIDDASWGWAPFHYGRWVYVDRYWGWAPGPIVARPYYAPALVAFFSAGPVTVGVNLGGAPLLGWTPLGWGEPCRPWWGPPRYAGRPRWFGWGGPRVTINQYNNINVYRNARARDGVVVVGRDHFARGPVDSHRVRSRDWSNLREVRGALPVQSDPSRVVGGARRGNRPPDSFLDRRVIATRRVAATPSGRGFARHAEAPSNPAAQLVPSPREARARGAVPRSMREQAGADRRVPSPRFEAVRGGRSNDLRQAPARIAESTPSEPRQSGARARGAPRLAQSPAPRPPSSMRTSPNGFQQRDASRSEARRSAARSDMPRAEVRNMPSPRVETRSNARSSRMQPRVTAARRIESRSIPSPRVESRRSAPRPEMHRTQARPSRVEARADSVMPDRARPRSPRVVAQNAPSSRAATQPRANGRGNAGAANRDPRRSVGEVPDLGAANGADARGGRRGAR